jgi:hypothetical protein
MSAHVAGVALSTTAFSRLFVSPAKFVVVLKLGAHWGVWTPPSDNIGGLGYPPQENSKKSTLLVSSYRILAV